MRKFRISINESTTDDTIFERYVFAATLDNACMNAKNLVGSGRWAHVSDAELIDVWAIVDEDGSYDDREHLHYGVDRINRAYDRLCDAIAIDDEEAADDFADLYEFYLEKFAESYGMSESKLEDIATDVRFLGWSGSTIDGEGHCSIAIAASHIASEKHYGGNYLVKTVAYNDEDMPERACNLIEDEDVECLLHCSECGAGAPKQSWAYWKFCPNCGRKVMRNERVQQACRCDV